MRVYKEFLSSPPIFFARRPDDGEPIVLLISGAPSLLPLFILISLATLLAFYFPFLLCGVSDFKGFFPMNAAAPWF